MMTFSQTNVGRVLYDGDSVIDLSHRMYQMSLASRSFHSLSFRFSDLSLIEKWEMCRKIGTKPADFMDDLAELDRMAAHF